MLNFDAEFQNGTTRVSKVWLATTLADGTNVEFHEDRVLLNGLVRDSSTTVDGQFTVGAAVTGKLSVVLNNSDDALSGYDFRGAVIVASLGGTLSNNTVQKVNIGRYYVDEYSYDGSNINLTAYDDMCRFDVPCKDTAFAWGSGKTVGQLVAKALSVAGLSLWNASLPGPEDYVVAKQPEQWDTMTWHDVIAYCAQIMCCFARIVYVPSPGTYQLKFEWYDMGIMQSIIYDGGTFKTTTTPYSDGAAIDGGTFDPWNDGDAVDGGMLGDRANTHYLGCPYSISVDTDDVDITGVSVVLATTDNIEADDDTQDYTKTLGTDGYVIEISGNPLIETTDDADAVCSYLYSCLNGLRFRPLNAVAIENPAMEAGDTAIITGRGDNTYSCFLSHVTYTVAAATNISCDAETTMQNSKGRYTGAQKTQALVQRSFDRSVSSTEQAMQTVMGAYAASMGLYPYEESDGQGGTIYTYGNNSTLASSDIRWRFSAGVLSVSSDYGVTWNAALSVDGTAVLQRLYAIGIEAQKLTVSNGPSTVFSADSNSGYVSIGGFAVTDSSLYYLKSSLSQSGSGVYIGTDGIAIGNSFKFAFDADYGDNYLKIGDTELLDNGGIFYLEGQGSMSFIIDHNAVLPYMEFGIASNSGRTSYQSYIVLNDYNGESGGSTGDLWICSRNDIHIVAGWDGVVDADSMDDHGTGTIYLGCSTYTKSTRI